MTSIEYELTVSAETPDFVIEGELFEIPVVLANNMNVDFPGIHTGVRFSWPSIPQPYSVYEPIDAEVIPAGESRPYIVRTTPPTSGYTMLLMRLDRPANDGNQVNFLLLDGRPLTSEGQPFAAVRVKSQLEILQERLIEVINTNSDATDKLTTRLTYLTIGVTLFIALIEIVLPIFYKLSN